MFWRALKSSEKHSLRSFFSFYNGPGAVWHLLDSILRSGAPSASPRVAALRSLDLGPPTLDEEAKNHL